MEVICPSCSGALDVPNDIRDGTQLQCPMCGKRFSFANREAKGSTEGSTRSGRMMKFAVVIALLMGLYFCTVVTWLLIVERRSDRCLRSISALMRSVESDVDFIQGDLSHIKIWGVEIAR